jgi:hypothetical protein
MTLQLLELAGDKAFKLSSVATIKRCGYQTTIKAKPRQTNQ